MDDFLKYFENERFVEWVLRPDAELNRFWEEYTRSHPDEKKQIELSRTILLHLKSRKEEADPAEAAALFAEMVVRLHKKPEKRIGFLKPLLRYAAVAILFLSIGILLVYKPGINEFRALNQPIEGLQNDNEARLILSDGKKIALPQKESTVEYEKNGKIVINRRDTIDNQNLASRTEMNRLIIPYGKSSSIRLPDGTMAYLNAGSQLLYPSSFRGKTREVFLLGEGYFEVAHNANVPFIVKTNDLDVVALGTKFNVSVYPTDKFIERVLVEGKVIIRQNSFLVFKKEVELKPGEMASFNRETLEAATKPVDIANYVTWREGYLNFQSTELNRIVLRLERYYNIKLFLDDPLLGMRRISGKLALKEDREKVLEVLATTSQAELFKLNESAYGLK